MNYSLSQLRVFQMIVKTESVTRAAQALHLSQPAVSVQLRNFQRNFDLPLTEVIGRQLFVTDFGHEIAALVNQTLNHLEAIDQQAAIHRGQLSGRLKIASASTGQYVLPYFLQDFVADHPEITLSVDVTNKVNVLESLRLNQVDLAVVSTVPPEMDVLELPLIKNELYLIGAAATDYADRKNDVSLLSELPLIYREVGSGTLRVMEQFIDRQKVAVRQRLQLTSNEAVKQAVLAGLGYSIMPLISLRNELAAGQAKIIPVKGLPLRTHWRLIRLRNKELAPVPAALVAHLEAERASIVTKKFGWLEAYG